MRQTVPQEWGRSGEKGDALSAFVQKDVYNRPLHVGFLFKLSTKKQINIRETSSIIFFNCN